MKNLALTAIICGASILGINATTYAAVISSATPITKIESSVETQELGFDWGAFLGGAAVAGTVAAIDGHYERKRARDYYEHQRRHDHHHGHHHPHHHRGW